MPLMMDDDMDIDDLFGDGAGLSLPSRPPTKELYQRVDDMRTSGCCQFASLPYQSSTRANIIQEEQLGQNGVVQLQLPRTVLLQSLETSAVVQRMARGL